ncbi:larval cuticle protein 16/17-like isoform X1 [Colias croceus]|uniref:larval cuticle protein 16/17-like isoform X1 n=1 Tax=Colias crocea TaxID=72248 RepID=UPI001E279E50|nr:larval cuticle protein 16/17-like isoform X1 [Colias croceus]
MMLDSDSITLTYGIHIQVKGTRLRCFIAIFFVAVSDYWPKTFGLGNLAKKHIYNNNGFGQYSFEFETSDGTYRHEDGGLFLNFLGVSQFAVRGEYRYKDPQGNYHAMKYIADENGFQPVEHDDLNRFNDRRIVK